MEYDFSGWATRNNIKCSDGRTIMKDAFKQNDGQKVPLVWNHQHDDPNEVLGHAVLENRDEGVYAYCKFNDTESGKTAKSLVLNGDVDKLSIYANKLRSEMNNVIHGCIREVSLVLAGANPGAFIDSVISHSETGEDEEEGVIYTDEFISIEHSDTEDGGENVTENNKENVADEKQDDNEQDEKEEKQDDNEQDEKEEKQDDNEQDEKEEKQDDNEQDDEISHADEESNKTVEEVFDSLTDSQKDVVYLLLGVIDDGGKISELDEEAKNSIKESLESMNEDQKNAVYSIVGTALEDSDGNKTEENKKEGEDSNMKHNVFDKETKDQVLAHSEFANKAIADAKRFGSMKESFLAHADEEGLTWEEANDFSILFPDAVNLNKEPYMVEKDNSWVAKVMSDVKHSPFSRVKNTLGRMDEPTARAKGYIKGDKKTNISMSVLNRVTTPTTVYIKNDIDRDDVIDITDFDVVAWQKKEMRKQLDKELALAMLLGDGRDVSDRNKINEQNIRPVVSDDDMYTIKYTVTQGRDYEITDNSYSENDSKTKGIIRAAIKARKEYKGSGKPTFYTTEDVLNDMLLIEDLNGRVIYESVDKLATALRVKEIVTIPEMESHTDIYGIIVNMNDYTAGADKGGSVNMFDDFDIDYNQMKYLIETRMSGALTVPKAAIVLKKAAASQVAEG